MAKALLTECKNQEGGTDSDYEILLTMNYPSTRTGICMISCTHEKLGIVSLFKFLIKFLINYFLSIQMEFSTAKTSYY